MIANPTRSREAPTGGRLAEGARTTVICWGLSDLKRKWAAEPNGRRDIALLSRGHVALRAGRDFDVVRASDGGPVPATVPDQADLLVDAGELLVPQHRSEGLTAAIAWDWKQGKLAEGARVRLCRPPGTDWLTADDRHVLHCNGTLQLYDLATGRPLWSATDGHTKAVSSVMFAPGGRIVSAGEDSILRVWSPTGRLEFQTPIVDRVWGGEHGSPVVDLSASGRLMFPDPKVPDGMRFRVLDLKDLAAPGTTLDIPEIGFPRSPTRIGLTRDGSAVYVVYHLNLNSKTTEEESLLARYDFTTKRWATLGPVPQNEYDATAWDPGHARLFTLRSAYDGPSGKKLADLEGAGQGPLAVTPNGRLVAGLGPGNPVRNRILEDTRGYRREYRTPDVCLWEADSGRRLVRVPGTLAAFPGLPGTISPQRLALHPSGRYLATSSSAGLHLWDLATGRVIHRFPELGPFTRREACPATALAFSPDGSKLATGLPDGTILLWDVPLPAPVAVAPADAPRLWAELMGDDPAAGWRAAWRLGDDPATAVRLARQRLAPAVPVPADELKQLLADVEAPRYAVRERATGRLEVRADVVGSAVAAALKKSTSEETRVRLSRVMAAVPTSDRPLPGWASAQGRAVAVVEHAAGPDARQLLETWANGAVDACLTREAQAAVGRLKGR